MARRAVKFRSLVGSGVGVERIGFVGKVNPGVVGAVLSWEAPAVMHHRAVPILIHLIVQDFMGNQEEEMKFEGGVTYPSVGRLEELRP